MHEPLTSVDISIFVSASLRETARIFSGISAREGADRASHRRTGIGERRAIDKRARPIVLRALGVRRHSRSGETADVLSRVIATRERSDGLACGRT